MTTVLKASNWLNGQLSSVMQLDSREAHCMEYHVCTSNAVPCLFCNLYHITSSIINVIG